MSSTHASSEKNTNKEIELGMLNSIEFKFDERVKTIPAGNVSYSYDIEEKGYAERSVYSNEVRREKDGSVKRINPKTGKPYQTRNIPIRIAEALEAAKKEDRSDR